jgi:hypothetical protein
VSAIAFQLNSRDKFSLFSFSILGFKYEQRKNDNKRFQKVRA